MSNYTSGPWKFVTYGTSGADLHHVLKGQNPVTGRDRTVAEACWTRNRREFDANCALLQHAPELFEVLENLLIETEGVPFRAIDCDQEVVDSLIERGHALIEKVKVEEE